MATVTLTTIKIIAVNHLRMNQYQQQICVPPVICNVKNEKISMEIVNSILNIIVL